jgi:phosphohistidine phosphatase SixA
VRLYLIRHAEAAPGDPDDLRPLTPTGREVARGLGQELAGEGIEVVLSSPLLRARETAELVAAGCGAPTEADERLAPGARLDDLRAAVVGRGEAVAVVGHQPDCSEIAHELLGRDPGFATGSACEISL